MHQAQVLDLFRVTAADRPGRGGLGDRRRRRPARLRVHRGPALARTDADSGRRVRARVEHHFLLAGDHHRSLGPHDDFAVTAEAVAIDRRVGHDHFLVRIVVVAGDPLLWIGHVVDRILVPDRELGIVIRPRELEHAAHMIFRFAVGGEEVSTADGVDGQAGGPSCRSLRKALTKIPAASNWWLPNSAINPPPVRLHSRHRHSSAIAEIFVPSLSVKSR